MQEIIEQVKKAADDMQQLAETLSNRKVSHSYLEKVKYALIAIDNLDCGVEPE